MPKLITYCMFMLLDVLKAREAPRVPDVSLRQDHQVTSMRMLSPIPFCFFLSANLCILYTQQSSAQVGVRVNSILTRNGCIKCYISFFKEIILQQLDAFHTEIQGSLTKMCAFKASRRHPSKVVKLPIISPGTENKEYLHNP